MEGSSQFERVSAWLRGQKRSIERVELGQQSAAELISTAEYELGCILRDLEGHELEAGQGIANLAVKHPAIARAARRLDNDALADALKDALLDAIKPAAEQTGSDGDSPSRAAARSREPAPLMARVKNAASDAA